MIKLQVKKRSNEIAYYQHKKDTSKNFRVNSAIRSKEVFLIDENGEPGGKQPVETALSMSKEVGLNLVEVGPNANPPVCKILDYGKFKYELKKKSQKSKSKKSGEVKEIRIGVNTEEHDFNTRIKKAKKFIERGNKIRVTVKMSGRENIYANRANQMIERFRQTLGLEIEQRPTRMGTRISAILARGK